MNRLSYAALQTPLFGLLFLIFLQLLTEFVAAIYAFGLLGVSIPVEIVAVLLLFSPLLLFLLPRGLNPFWLRLLPLLVLVARGALPLLSTRGRLFVAGLGVALFLFWLPAWLAAAARRREAWATAWTLGAGLLLATAASTLLRVLGAGLDASTSGGQPWLAWLLVVVAALLLPALPVAPGDDTEEKRQALSFAGWARRVLLVAGLVAVLAQLYFGFAAPHVIARWVEMAPLPILGLLALATAVWALVLAQPRWRGVLTPRVLWLLTLFFAVFLAVTLELWQVWFPPNPGSYPLRSPAIPGWYLIPLLIALLLAPVLYADFIVLAASLLSRRPTPRLLAGAFSLGSLLLLLLIFAHVFTTVYDYIPVVGPLFRDRFWVVGPLPAFVLSVALLAVRDGRKEEAAPGRPWRWALPLLAVLLGAAALLGEALRSPIPRTPIGLTLGVPIPPPAPAGPTLRVLTYNIQQGYNAAGERDYDAQLAVLREADADVIGLQESDAARIANGNDDLVRYYAEALDYYSYYGPSPVVGTFGIALLSRTPLIDPQTFYMYSEGEQTATIVAGVETESGRCQIYVTHLGNGGPLVQQQAILRRIGAGQGVVLMGDFNFRPETEQYALTTETLVDAWASSGGQPDAAWLDPAQRIDHIFVLPDVAVEEARYLETEASDHPPLVAEVRCAGG